MLLRKKVKWKGKNRKKEVMSDDNVSDLGHKQRKICKSDVNSNSYNRTEAFMMESGKSIGTIDTIASTVADEEEEKEKDSSLTTNTEKENDEKRPNPYGTFTSFKSKDMRFLSDTNHERSKRLMKKRTLVEKTVIVEKVEIDEKGKKDEEEEVLVPPPINRVESKRKISKSNLEVYRKNSDI